MSSQNDLTHIDGKGNARMVDVGDKAVTKRTATAEARLLLPPAIQNLFDGRDLHVAKGPVFQTAVIAGIMAAKKTGELIPLCHPLGIDKVDIDIRLEKNEAVVTCEATVRGKTGVEMEALTGASIAALTIYDMCKALSHDIIIREIKLIEKTGGKRDFNRNA